MTLSCPRTTDGWRGTPGTTWAEPQILQIIADLAADGHLGNTIAVGFDGRGDACELAHLVSSLLAHLGRQVHLSDSVLPTPALGRYVHAHPRISAGVMVTASHNPAGYIGLKVRDAHGQGVPYSQPSTPAAPPTLDALDRHPATRDLLGPYRRRVTTPLETAATTFADTIVLDAAHGATGTLRPDLPSLTWRRSTVLPFFAGLTPDPALRPQADHIARQALDDQPHAARTMIAMTDGDGDRLTLYTQRSGYIDSAEQATILLAAGLRPTVLLVTVVAPRKLTESARRHGVPVHACPVGFKNIITAWRHAGHPAAIAVEPNGAVVVATPDSYFERDALDTLTCLLNTFGDVAALDDAVAAVRQRFPYPQHILTTHMPLETIQAQLTTLLEGHPTLLNDGTSRWETNDWQVAARASGTESLVRIYVETDQGRLDAIQRLIERLEELNGESEANRGSYAAATS